MMYILSCSMIGLPEHSFRNGSVIYVLCAFLFLAIIDSLRMRRKVFFLEQRNDFLLDAIRQATYTLMTIKNMYDELAADNLPPLIAVSIRQLAAQIGDVINRNKSALSVSGERSDGELNLDECELYSVPAVENAGYTGCTDELPHIVLIMEDKKLSGNLKAVLSRSYRVSVYEHYERIDPPLSNDNTDIIIMDAESVDGKLCSRIKKNKHTSDVTVLLLTPFGNAEDLKKYENWRADRLLPRTVPVERLEEEIISILEERRQQIERVIRLVNTDFSGGFPDDFLLSEEDAVVLRKINGFIEEHLAGKCTKKMLAGELGVCTTKLFTIVKGITKVSIARYIFFFKMERAKKLLLSGKHKVGEVANMLGYGDVHYFGKVFKKYYNCTSTEFMKRQGSSVVQG